MSRVLILSVHPLFGQGMESLLRQAEGLEIIGREAEVDKALERIRILQPDVVVIDDAQPSADSGAVVLRVLQEGLGCRVVGLSLQDNSMSIYYGEQRVINNVDEFIQMVRHISLWPWHESTGPDGAQLF